MRTLFLECFPQSDQFNFSSLSSCFKVHKVLFLVCRLNEEARNMIADMGSTAVNGLGFRDNWVFVGGKGIKTKSPFEQVRGSRQKALKK